MMHWSVLALDRMSQCEHAGFASDFACQHLFAWRLNLLWTAALNHLLPTKPVLILSLTKGWGGVMKLCYSYLVQRNFFQHLLLLQEELSWKHSVEKNLVLLTFQLVKQRKDTEIQLWHIRMVTNGYVEYCTSNVGIQASQYKKQNLRTELNRYKTHWVSVALSCAEVINVPIWYMIVGLFVRIQEDLLVLNSYDIWAHFSSSDLEQSASSSFNFPICLMGLIVSVS